MKRRIGIDAHMVGAQETGNETYVLNLLRSLPRADQESRFDYQAIALAPEDVLRHLDRTTDIAVVQVKPAQPLLRIPFAMPILAARQQLDLCHFTYVVPPLCPCPTVVTVHDVAFRLYPDHFPAGVRLMLSLLVPFSMRRASKVITVSHSAKRDILACYAVPEEKIVVTHEAAAPQFHVIDDRDVLDQVRRQYGIHKEFILTVGNLQPRKNIRRLIQAYGQLDAHTRDLYQLVIVGQDLWQASDIYTAVIQHGLQPHTLFTGYVPDEDLVVLYNAAKLFVYPTLYEGFGLPVLEAMACGTPVITSSVSSLPEIAGDAAVLINPRDVNEITAAMTSVLANPDLSRRLSTRGLRRSHTFSWERTARETLEVYREIAG